MNLRLALPGGRVLKVDVQFPYDANPIGYRALVGSKTAIVVGVADKGEKGEKVVFPDRKPITTEKHINALISMGIAYGLNPWYLLHELLPAPFDWEEVEVIKLTEKDWKHLDKLSTDLLEYLKEKKEVKKEKLEEKFGKQLVEKLLSLGFLTVEKVWKAPDLEVVSYRLVLTPQEAYLRLRRFKNKSEKIRLISYLAGRAYATQEELKENGFSSKDIKDLLKKGIIEEFSQHIEEVLLTPKSLRQERVLFLKPMGNKGVLFGNWKRVLETFYSLVEEKVSRNKSVFIYCRGRELLNRVYSELKSLYGDRVLRISSMEKGKEFVKRWFFAQESPCVVVGSDVSLLLHVKDPALFVCIYEQEPKLHNGVDIRNYLYELSKLYASEFLIIAPFLPLEVYGKKGWTVSSFNPSCEVKVIKKTGSGVLAPETIEILKTCSEEKNLFLVNKHGYAYAFCKKCGWLVECPRCSTLLTLSKQKDKVFCTSCNYRAPNQCPECKSPLEEYGFGLDKAIEEVSKAFGYKDNFYFDTTPRLLEEYDNVFILHCDNLLSLPHFDAQEKYFSYVWKSACIAKKRLIVQTLIEENSLLEYIKSFDWEGFVKEELERRKEEYLPPYSRLIRARFTRLPEKSLLALPGNVSLRRMGGVVDALIRVEKSLGGRVLKAVRSLNPIELEVI